MKVTKVKHVTEWKLSKDGEEEQDSYWQYSLKGEGNTRAQSIKSGTEMGFHVGDLVTPDIIAAKQKEAGGL